jgi:ABC-type sulfate/molybdate transport systems ATPase subunit
MSESGARPPLFELEQARVGRAGGSIWGPFTARADGARLALLGDFSPWFAALAGVAPLASGRALLAGAAVTTALRAQVAGYAPLDPAFPPRWTVRAYLQNSASLLGRERRATSALVDELIVRFELAHLASKELASLRVAERRVISIAAATLGEPAVICCEAPLDRLDNAAQAYVEAALERAIAGRGSVVSIWRLPGLGRERALAERADAVLALDAGQLRVLDPAALQNATVSRFILTVRKNAAALGEALQTAGLSVERLGNVGAYRALELGDDDFQRLRVGGQATRGARPILDAAAAVDASIVELVPDDGEGFASSRVDA